ncbi:hypothetical protein [Methanobacterium alcaliphilum]|uniref:hypothetical protein n=1 Tax=Methanobacterium alcaliphilum TaxID=392018 RepID=UPI00200A0100|nr:hypothetical protein [Methanobacterium alcaliphilum]MCK9152548.1 hypothetical protein [Methanobacterium alcaliphilum]
MKRLVKIMAILFVCGFLLAPSAFAANDSSSTDPDLSNNEASVTVEPYDDSQPVENEADGKDTVAMQPTGVPMLGVILAFFMIATGFLTVNKR